MRPVAADAVIAVEGFRQCVAKGLGWQRGEVGGVEHQHLRDRQCFCRHRFDHRAGRWIVQRRAGVEFAEFGDHLLVNERRRGELVAALHDAVADRRERDLGMPVQSDLCGREVIGGIASGLTDAVD